MEKWWCLCGETTVSLRRNYSSEAGNRSFQGRKRQPMYVRYKFARMASPPSAGRRGVRRTGWQVNIVVCYSVIYRFTISPATSPYGDSPPPTSPLSGESNLPEGGESKNTGLYRTDVNVYNKLLHSWRISLCKVYTVLQILYLQPICRRYLQRSNYLSTSALHAFGCRWQMFSCFFNFMVGGLRIKIMLKTVQKRAVLRRQSENPVGFKDSCSDRKRIGIKKGATPCSNLC